MAFTVVLGGARSGKSAYAQQEAERLGLGCIMIATAEALDAEMHARIVQHQAERGPQWRTVEAPVDLVKAISSLQPGDVAVVDCLTLWVSNLLMRERDINVESAALEVALCKTPATVWVVSNEVGWGIVPDNALARQFRDVCGRLHQRLAKAADHAVLVVAGLPTQLK